MMDVAGADLAAARNPDPGAAPTRLVFQQELSEVQLLLDFISGRPELSLTQDSKDQALDIHSVIDRVCRLRFPPTGTADNVVDDTRFLLLARDQLNTLLARCHSDSLTPPARGRSIAFTSMVMAEDAAAAEPPRASLARLAFPELAVFARRLRRWMGVLIGLTVIVGFLTVWLSGELAAGKLLLDRIDTIKRDAETLDAQIERAEPPAVSGAHVVRFCDRTAVLGPAVLDAASGSITGVQQFDSAVQYHLCDQFASMVQRKKGAYEHLDQWLRRMKPLAALLAVPVGDVEDSYNRRWTLQSAAAVMLGTLGGYALPVLYAFLGAGVSAIRNYYRRMAASVLLPRDLVLSWVRLALGLVTGSLIGLIVSPSAGTGTDSNTLTTAVSLSGAALAFLAGYGVEQVFSFFDDLLLRVFRSAQPQTADHRAS